MDSANVRAIFDQFWTQARHAEEQRQTFFQFYLVVIGVGVGIIGQNLASAVASGLALTVCVFLVAVSVFGLFLTFSWNVAYTLFTRQAERIQLCHLDPGAGYVNFYGPLRWPKARLRVTLSALRLLPLGYALGGGVFGAGALAAASVAPPVAIAGGCVALAVLALLSERYFDPHRQLYHMQFERDIDAVMRERAHPAHQ
jgi:hypothetical protein